MAQILIHKIVWKQNSPYGTYVAGDEVSIFWDDVTENLAVEKNGGTITSGSDIPFTFIYSGQPDTYYKTEEHYYPLVCTTAFDGLLTIRNISAFPYLTPVLLPDYPSCAASPDVCDLVFDSLPVVVKATDSTTADGEVTVSATSSHGSIEYKLGGDFVFGDGDNTDGIFTGLLPGNYIIYARDAINCLAQISVTIPIDYVYGPLLRIEYYDFIGNQSKVEILEKSYSGSVTEVDGIDYSCFTYTVRGEGENDKFKPILSTESSLNLVSVENFQFSTLFTSDPDKYRVRFSKNTGSGYAVKLLHKFLPNQYQEDYLPAPHATSFISVDGTATLKDIPFADAMGTRLFGSYKQISLIAFCLQKLNLELNIRCSINLYADTMATTATDDPLDQAYVDVSVYYLDGKQPTCDDVIKAILSPYKAQLKQWDNVWNITRVEEVTNDYDYREFDSTGAYVSNGSYSPVKDVKSRTESNALNWVKTPPKMVMLPGYGTIKSNYNLGLQSNILINGDFKLKTQFLDFINSTVVTANIDGFQLIYNDENVDVAGSSSYEIIDANDIALVLYSYTGLYLLSKTYELKMSFADKLKFKLTYKTSATPREYPYQKIKIQVVYGSYYLQSDGFWTTTANTILYYSKEFGKYTDLEITAVQPDATALDGLNIYVKLFASFLLDAEFDTLAGLRAKTTTTLPLGTRTELLPSSSGGGVTIDWIYYYELENNTSAESVPDIVRPTDYNAVTNPVQWILKSKVTSDTSLINNQFYVNRIALEYMPEGKEAPKTFNDSIAGEQNNPEILEEEYFHGSLTNDIVTTQYFGIGIFENIPGLSTSTVGTENADKIYTGYLRDVDGNGYVNWSRDNVPESRLLHEITLRVIAAQYSRPWRKIFGSLVSRDIYLTPIDCIKETADSDRKYYPISMTVDDKRNQYDCEMVEISDPSDDSDPSGGGSGTGGSGSGGSGAGFTTGFTIGFDS